MSESDEEAIHLPIDGELDLHLFRPSEIAEVVTAYLDACHEEGIREVRICHGKGKGTQRRIVASLLEKREDVQSFRTAPPERGGWGATLVDLKRETTPE